MRKLKEKEEQIERISKLNFVLEEKVKSLYAENQWWRDLAQTNEATANSLRVDLGQALARVGNERRAEDDVESCCGSSSEEEDCYSDRRRRRCRMCGERESCVLMLPCRHLCLCDVCGSGSYQIQACPVCNSSMKATLHVNMSMS
ncbi:E3 ubiquitin-protein ligase boi [Phtheirospermum japonicum]|uniref:E3 ubiquitin-protein ligase boi n=1 Tax=Phtheirospermum japonicum TaxID=374723 RepID=A0A830BFX1_9LAMI|nr:E3 ubiquitin-protein ligase boi [Phtheirospermum japonicum]